MYCILLKVAESWKVFLLWWHRQKNVRKRYISSDCLINILYGYLTLKICIFYWNFEIGKKKLPTWFQKQKSHIRKSIGNIKCISRSWHDLPKGSFFNYVDKSLPFFDHLPTPSRRLWRNSFTVTIRENLHTLDVSSTTPILPRLVNVVCERPLT